MHLLNKMPVGEYSVILMVNGIKKNRLVDIERPLAAAL